MWKQSALDSSKLSKVPFSSPIVIPRYDCSKGGGSLSGACGDLEAFLCPGSEQDPVEDPIPGDAFIVDLSRDSNFAMGECLCYGLDSSLQNISTKKGEGYYHLRLRNLHPTPQSFKVMGLDFPKEIGVSTVDHKSAFKITQARTVKEVNQGKQRLLVGVLRAKKTPLGFPHENPFLNYSWPKGQAKKVALKRYITLNSTEFVFIQETMGKGGILIKVLRKMLVDWDFLALDVVGSSRDLISSLCNNLALINSFAINSSLFTNLFYKSLKMVVSLLNAYGPYEGKEVF